MRMRLLLLVLLTALFSHVHCIPKLPSATFYNYLLESMFDKNLTALFYSNEPFPHIYFDDFFPKKILQEVAKEFPVPNPNSDEWKDGNIFQSKDGCYVSDLSVQRLKVEFAEISTETMPYIDKLIGHMQSKVFLEFLVALTGIQGLVPDPYLFGAGPHQTLRGGHLDLHLDYNFNDRIQMWRRVNVFLYLTEVWEQDWGGHLELWNKDLNFYRAISPVFNRLLIFEPSEISWHGHPHALQCPSHRTRNSIALYYYTVDQGPFRQGAYTAYKRETSFIQLDIDKVKGAHMHVE